MIRLVCVLALVVLPFLAAGGQQDANQAKKKNAEKPLLLDDEPLLLDDEPLLLDDDDAAGASGPVADNSRCHVCHLNYAHEELAVTHAKANIGCAKCHGNCDEHIADESWASGGNGTPPEIMYPREKIDPACGKCHKKHDVPASEVVARWLERRPAKAAPERPPNDNSPLPQAGEGQGVRAFAAQTQNGSSTAGKPVVCTDCHGRHRLKERKCKWK